MASHRIFGMPVAKVYPLYVRRAWSAASAWRPSRTR